MWYIEMKSLINDSGKDNWVQQYSYTGDHYSLAKHDMELLKSKHESREFRLVCKDNF